MKTPSVLAGTYPLRSGTISPKSSADLEEDYTSIFQSSMESKSENRYSQFH